MFWKFELYDMSLFMTLMLCNFIFSAYCKTPSLTIIWPARWRFLLFCLINNSYKQLLGFVVEKLQHKKSPNKTLKMDTINVIGPSQKALKFLNFSWARIWECLCVCLCQCPKKFGKAWRIHKWWDLPEILHTCSLWLNTWSVFYFSKIFIFEA